MSNGFLYVIWGDQRFVREVCGSVTSLRRHSPGAHATVVCDVPPAALPQLSSCLDRVITQPIDPRVARELLPHLAGFTYKVRNMYEHAPYERTCFVDSDTYFLADFQPLFDILDYFDMAMTLPPGDITPTRANGKELQGYTPYNTGMILFKKGERTERFFDRWSFWQGALDEPDYTGSDQETFMRALLDVPCRICVLQSTWNTRTQVYERLRGPVRLIHGRHADFEAIARNINITSDTRVWVPGVDLCLYDRMSMAHHWKYCVKATWLLWRQWLRELGRPPRKPWQPGSASTRRQSSTLPS